MIISGTTLIVVNGKSTRVCGREFNRALRAGKNGSKAELTLHDASGAILVPSKGLSWNDVAKAVRAGKKVQAKAA